MTVKVSGLFVNTGNPQFVRFANRNGTTQTSVAGGPVGSNQYLIDGVPITETNNRPIAIPTIESIQDVKVQANTYSLTAHQKICFIPYYLLASAERSPSRAALNAK